MTIAWNVVGAAVLLCSLIPTTLAASSASRPVRSDAEVGRASEWATLPDEYFSDGNRTAMSARVVRPYMLFDYIHYVII